MVVEINSQQDDEEFEQNNNYTQQYGCHARLKTQDTAVNVVKVFGEFEFSMQHLSRVHTDFFFFFFFRRVATINRLIILPLFSACRVFLCFRKTPNSDTDYRTFNMHTWSFLRVSIHTGVGHTLTASHHIFYSENLQKKIIVPLTGLELWSLGSWNLESDALLIEPPWHTCDKIPWLFQDRAIQGYNSIQQIIITIQFIYKCRMIIMIQ